ncbi:MAG TPA: methylated-DNA--[protein]-cysteine S-methyltransferase [Acidimicrobiia bacterium]|nr:methylated-DNA--[protein]-cysteine S-methyltransferase [Acidimicrobiia bacterium]
MTEYIEDALEGLRSSPPTSTRTAVELGVGLLPGYARYEAPIGEVAVVFTPEGVRSVRLASEVDPRAVEARPPKAWARRIPRALEEGRPGDLPLDLRTVTEFRRQVLQVAATIPRGEVRSYGWLARRIGKPQATRAVGSAMATNPVPLIVPCHRVVRSDGHIGAYSLGGPDNKWTLLRHEGAEPDQLEDLAASGVRYLASDTTGVFCVPSCHHARRITAPHRHTFRSDEAATAAGYRPCKSCRPLG